MARSRLLVLLAAVTVVATLVCFWFAARFETRLNRMAIEPDVPADGRSASYSLAAREYAEQQKGSHPMWAATGVCAVAACLSWAAIWCTRPGSDPRKLLHVAMLLVFPVAASLLLKSVTGRPLFAGRVNPDSIRQSRVEASNARLLTTAAASTLAIAVGLAAMGSRSLHRHTSSQADAQ